MKFDVEEKQNLVSGTVFEDTLKSAGISRLFFLIVPVNVKLYGSSDKRSNTGTDENQLSQVTVRLVP